jgi:N-acetylmuramoyl-L-alanine amidase
MFFDKRIRLVLLVAILAAGAAVSLASVTPEQRQQAVTAFEKAEKLRSALQAQPEGKRRIEDYKRVIDAYNEAVRLNPAYSKTPVALQDVAELYRQMGREFSSDTYLLESVKTYRFLGEQYPKNHMSRDAWYAIAKIYQEDLEDPESARKAFQYYIAMYPKTDQADEARKYLAGPEKSPAQPVKPAAAEATVLPELPLAPVPTPRAELEKTSGGLRMVSAVRHWVGPNYLRIVIETDGEVKFDSVRLSNPDRIVVDLQGSRLSHDLGARTFPIENGFLRQIRVAQFSGNVSRVVLDAEKIDSYSIFSLPNPFRLVIDVQGGNAQQIAKSTSPPAPETNSDARKPVKVAAPLPAIPTPSAPVEVAVRNPTPTVGPVRSGPEPSTPAANNEVVVAVVPPPEVKPKKKSKNKTETVAAVAPTPEIEPVGPVAANPLPAGPMEDGSRTLTRALGLKIGRIVIDPGHGGHDTGTLGPTGLEEKEVVLDVSLKLKKLLEENTNCEVIMTRSDDTFIPLEERTAIANEKSADLFISVHANASPDKSARGIETYYLNFTSSPDALEVAARENASSQEAVHQLQDLIKKIAMTEKIEESQDFATQVQREIYAHVTKASGAQRDRGVKKAPFVVLIGANMPSVLAEISFLTNPKDEHLLRKPEYREKIAEALYDGVLDYLKTLGVVKAVQRVAADQPTVARPN